MANKRSGANAGGSSGAKGSGPSEAKGSGPSGANRPTPAPNKRVTPKGTAPSTAKSKGGGPGPTKRTTPKETGRYTPPIPKTQKVSPVWVPILMFTCLLVGMAMIISNYVSLLPGSPTNGWLLGGLGLITVGFITATKYH